MDSLMHARDLLKRAGVVPRGAWVGHGATSAAIVVVESAHPGDGLTAPPRVAALRRSGYAGAIVVAGCGVSREWARRCVEAGADRCVDILHRPQDLLVTVRPLLDQMEDPAIHVSDDGRDWREGIAIVDENRRTVWLGTYAAELQEVSFRLLMYLREHGERWVRHHELNLRVLQRSAAAESNIRWHISRVRDALGPWHAVLHGDRTLGYMFSCQDCGRPHCRDGVGTAKRKTTHA